MNKILRTLLFFALFACAEAYAVENYLNTKETLDFDNTEFTLGWSSHPREIQYLQEYFPKGQSPENFKDMLSVWLFVGDFSAEAYIQNMTATYAERKKTDIVCQYKVYSNNGEYMFECVLSESDQEGLAALEMNIYRCKDVEIDGKKALLICFYSRQARGENMTPFLEEMKARREQMLMAMVKFQYPEIMLK